MAEQLALDCVKPSPVRPRRVLMQVADAGADGYMQWRCPSCLVEETSFYDKDPGVSYREPCARCGPVYGTRRRKVTCRTQTYPWSAATCTREPDFASVPAYHSTARTVNATEEPDHPAAVAGHVAWSVCACGAWKPREHGLGKPQQAWDRTPFMPEVSRG